MSKVTGSAPLIEIEQLTYRHPGRGGEKLPPVLKNVSLQIERGEFVALIGANGSGKTTLARHMNALLMPGSGRVLVNGLDTRSPVNHLAIRATVGMVFQNPADQIVATVVEEDVAFGPENLGVPPGEIRQRVRSALQAVDMWAERDRPPHLLSAGQMQRVALAGVLAMRPACIIFDETTAMLDPAGRRKVLEIMRQLNRDGLTIIYITHFMEDVLSARRVVVLRQGEVALDDTPQAVFVDPLRVTGLGLEMPPAALLAEQLRPYFPGLPAQTLALEELLAALPAYDGSLRETPSEPAAAERPALIEVEGLHHTYLLDNPLSHHALRGASLRVGQGETHGVIGATGSGKSTLIQHLNGLMRPQQGSVRVGPFDMSDHRLALKTVCQTVGLVFQNPEMQLFEQYVGDEIAYGPRQMGLARPELRERVRWAMELVGLDFERDKDRMTAALSGGERRKVALASTLALQPEILVLDEPTAGLDPQARRWLLGRLAALQAEGMTIVLSSHQMEDMAVLADGITVMQAGRDMLHGTTAEVFAEGVLIRSLGLDTPLVVQAGERLAALGWPLPGAMVRLEALLAVLSRREAR